MKSCKPNLALGSLPSPVPHPSYLELSFVTNDVEGCPLWSQEARIRWSAIGVGGAEEISAS